MGKTPKFLLLHVHKFDRYSWKCILNISRRLCDLQLAKSDLSWVTLLVLKTVFIGQVFCHYCMLAEKSLPY